MSERWAANGRRADGCSVLETMEGTFVIMPKDEGLPVDTCPCCVKPFFTQRAAMVCADIIFPMQETGDVGSSS